MSLPRRRRASWSSASASSTVPGGRDRLPAESRANRLNNLGDVVKADAPGHEGLDGDLVGGVEDRRHRPSGPQGGSGQDRHGKPRLVRPLEA